MVMVGADCSGFY